MVGISDLWLIVADQSYEGVCGVSRFCSRRSWSLVLVASVVAPAAVDEPLHAGVHSVAGLEPLDLDRTTSHRWPIRTAQLTDMNLPLRLCPSVGEAFVSSSGSLLLHSGALHHLVNAL